jgi:DNA-binding NarL/FixJ family response regulator
MRRPCQPSRTQALGLPDLADHKRASEICLETETKTVRILVVDDHDIIRRGLRELLTMRQGWEVCGEAKTGREAVALAEQLQPEIVVMDVSMPELNGLEAARRIHEQFPRMGILILTLHFSDQLVRDIVAAGARAYILKSDTARDLVSAVEAVANRQTFFTPRAAEVLLDSFSRKGSELDAKVLARSRLTPREREIVHLLAEGKTSKEVGLALGISMKTAETHRANIMRKLEVHSVSEVVRYAVKNHIVEI